MQKSNNTEIEKTHDHFVKMIKRYVKHKGLELELTLKNGETILIKRDRELVGQFIVTGATNSPQAKIALSEISRADVYAT